MATHLPLLLIQRELCALPRGPERFRAYLRVLQTPDGDDLALPLAIFNPMAKEHVGARLDAHLEDGYEEIAGQAIEEANRRLGPYAPPVQVGLVVADDARGGWTHGAMTDFNHRFDNRAELRRGFATVLLWTSETLDEQGLHERVLATVYRAAYRARVRPDTLGGMMRQEGLASRFAAGPATLDDDAARALEVRIAPHRDSSDYAVIVPCLYGDSVASEVGHRPLGLPERAGFRLARFEADREDVDPAAELAARS